MRDNLKLAIWAVSLLPLLLYSVIYGFLGETIPISWNDFGEVTSYITKTWAVFILPITAIFISLMLYYIKEIKDDNKLTVFKVKYDIFWLFINILVAFITMFPLYLMLFDGGNTYNVLAISLLIVAVLVLIAGFIFPQFKFEGKYGFITPWTRASSKVFYRTQQVAASTFTIGSLFLAGLTLFVSDWDHTALAVLAYILVLLLLILIPLLYSKKTYENED